MNKKTTQVLDLISDSLLLGKQKTHKSLILNELWVFKVRVIGLEPTRLAAPDPKSGMSTNFTIPAKL